MMKFSQNKSFNNLVVVGKKKNDDDDKKEMLLLRVSPIKAECPKDRTVDKGR